MSYINTFLDQEPSSVCEIGEKCFYNTEGWGEILFFVIVFIVVYASFKNYKEDKIKK